MLLLIGILLVGLLVTAASVAGIVFIAQRYKNENGAGKVLLVLGMVGLGLFALAGVFATGCSAIMMSTFS